MIIDEIRRLRDEVRDTMHNLGMKAVVASCNLKLHSTNYANSFQYIITMHIYHS